MLSSPADFSPLCARYSAGPPRERNCSAGRQGVVQDAFVTGQPRTNRVMKGEGPEAVSATKARFCYGGLLTFTRASCERMTASILRSMGLGHGAGKAVTERSHGD